MMMLERIWRLLRPLAVSIPLFLIFGLATLAQLLAGNPPLNWPTDPSWFATPPNPWVLLTAIFSAVGAISAIASFFAPAPYSREQGQDDRRHQNESFRVADERADARHVELLTKITEMTDRIARTDPQAAIPLAEALTGLSTGNESDQSIALEAVTGDPVAAADRLLMESADRARTAARIYAPFAPSKAMAAYRTAVDADPTDAWSWIELGRLQRHYAGLSSARACFDTALQHVTDERDRSVLDNEIGNLELTSGNLAAARRRFEASLNIANRFARLEPDNIQWQRDLTISYNKLGEVEVAAGDIIAARKRFEAGLEIRERLARLNPGSIQWQRDLSISYSRLGDIEVTAGDLAAARPHFEASLNIADRLAPQEPGNTQWQRDLSVCYNKLGEIGLADGDITAARQRFEASLDIAARLAGLEPGNAQWQRDLSISYNKLGDVELAAGEVAAARQRFTAGLDIRERLARLEPGNAQSQRDLYVSLARLAQIVSAEGDTLTAIAHLEQAEGIMMAVVARASTHPGYAKDLAEIRASLDQLREPPQV